MNGESDGKGIFARVSVIQHDGWMDGWMDGCVFCVRPVIESVIHFIRLCAVGSRCARV